MSPTPPPPNIIIIGLSGPSSSGKTTLARLLRQIFNVESSTEGCEKSGDGSTRMRLFILHEDDFYKTDKDIPLKHIPSPPSPFGTRTLQDWDCIESLDLPLLSTTLHHIRDHGVLPSTLSSKEDQNTVGESGVSESTVLRYHSEITSWVTSLPTSSSPSTSTTSSMAPPQLPTDNNEQNDKNDNPTITICLLDGFLLYPSPTTPKTTPKHTLLTLLNATLTARLFIPSTKSQTITRRNARKGYVTMEGFWEDPEGYVEDVVWPNYCADHAWLFDGTEGMEAVDGGRVDRGVAADNGIAVGPGCGEVQLDGVLEWAIGRVKSVVEGVVL